MQEINLQLVREFFELNGFRVQTQWRQDGEGRQLYVENAHPAEVDTVEVVLGREDARSLERAVVEVRPWHAERIYASTVEANPILVQFARPEALSAAREHFSGASFRTILVLSELPHVHESRSEAVEALRRAGVDHVLEFETVLSDLVTKTSVTGAYPSSATLQTIQLLNRYHLTQRRQLEFVYPMDPPPPAGGPRVETAELPSENESDED